MAESLTNPSRYLKHRAAGSEWTDGSPWDTGTAQTITNNYYHLAGESYRHLVWSAVPGTFDADVGVTEDGSTYAGDTAPPGSGDSGLGEIAWNPVSCFVFQTIRLLVDQRSSGALLPRKVHYRVVLTRTGLGTAYAYLALTMAGLPPRTDSYLAGTGPVAVTVSTVLSGSLQPGPIGEGVGQTWTCRNAPRGGPTRVGVLPVSFWLGFKVANTASIGVGGVSLFEAP